jgi:hypothetical protein
VLALLFELDTLSVQPQGSLLGLLIAFVNNFHFNLVVMFVYFVNQSSVLSSILNGVTNFIIHLVIERMTRYRESPYLIS